MAIANHLAIDRWAAQITGAAPTSKYGKPLSMKGSTVYAIGDTIYSYGRHFPMARIYPDYILVNGDTWGPTTGRHQSDVRSAIRGHRQLIVPFSALNAAGIDHDSIRPLEILDDTWTLSYREQTLAEMQNGWIASQDDDGAWSVADQRAYLAPPIPCEQLGPNLWRVPILRHWLGEAVFSARSNGRRRHFLSAFDHNEAGQVYFLCELPTRAETVAQAFEDLAPAIVKRALAMDIDVKRQGDMFAIPCELPAECTRPAPYKRNTALYEYVPFRAPGIVANPNNEPLLTRDQKRWPTLPRYETVRWANWRVRGLERNSLHGTDHTASEVLRGRGPVYARGILRHEPRDRRPDHANVKLDGWHLIVPNTCPR